MIEFTEKVQNIPSLKLGTFFCAKINCTVYLLSCGRKAMMACFQLQQQGNHFRQSFCSQQRWLMLGIYCLRNEIHMCNPGPIAYLRNPQLQIGNNSSRRLQLIRDQAFLRRRSFVFHFVWQRRGERGKEMPWRGIVTGHVAQKRVWKGMGLLHVIKKVGWVS